MTTPSSRSPRLLLVATLVLTVAGVILLTLPTRSHTTSATTPPAQAVRPASPSTSEDPATRAPGPSKSAVAAPTAPVIASALPPHGEGVAGDRVIQQALEAAWPADLAAKDEQQLLADGRALLRADATGIGRDRWTTFSGKRDQAIAPPFATARFRVQALIARRDGTVDQAVVHLVWAGTDRGGTYTDGRITDLHFTRTTSTKNGDATWTPQPRT